jgi:hypothetical protein
MYLKKELKSRKNEDDLREDEFYDLDYREKLMDEDEISAEEEGFMYGWETA